MTTRGSLMFHELAPYYDLLLAEKDYSGEARQLIRLAHHYARSGGTEWLDVACGTGRHLELLGARYSVTGLDRSAQMLAVARRRLPKTRLVRADMRTFRLGRRFDVITCLFGAIGNVTTERGAQETLANFSRHLRPGGLLILEPWIDPAEYRVGFLRLMQYADPSTKVVRLAYSERRGNHSVSRTHFLLGEWGRGMKHFEESDVRLMVPYARLRAMMRSAGLRPTIARRGLVPGRPLFLGHKPR